MEGHAIRVLRTLYSLTQIALADEIGCSANYLHKIENQKLKLSNDMRKRLATYFNITPGEFMVFSEQLSSPAQALQKIMRG